MMQLYMLYLLNKIFIKVNLIESKFSPDPPRNKILHD